MNESVPFLWKGNLSDVEETVSKVKKGKCELVCKSAGGRNIYLVSYGKENVINTKANYNSACGGQDISCYADKSSKNYRKTLFLIGNVHGGEFEGTVAINNLISIMETGADISGKDFSRLREGLEKYNLLIIPSINPDGRSRVPFDSLVGEPLEVMRHYNQGTWKTGGLCNWPDCKKVHPIKEASDYLGGYFNDDGINLMHDNFFLPMAKETKVLMKIADKYAPDLTVMLHGGANCRNLMIKPAYCATHIYEEIACLEKIWQEKCERESLRYRQRAREDESSNPPTSFNLASALTHICGAPCVTYETNQGLDYGEEIYSYAEIYRHHMVLFESILSFFELGIKNNNEVTIK